MHTSPTLCDASVRVGCHTGDITPSEFAIGTSKLIGALTTIRWGGACRCRRHDIAQSAVLTWIIVTRGHVEFASIPGKVLEDDIMNFGRKKNIGNIKKENNQSGRVLLINLRFCDYYQSCLPVYTHTRLDWL